MMLRPERWAVALLLLPPVVAPLGAQQPRADSVTMERARRPLIRWEEALGVAAIAGLALATDKAVSDRIADPHDRLGRHLSDIGNGFGDGVIVYSTLIGLSAGTKLIGWKGAHGVSLRALESTATAGAAALALKALLGRERPNVDPDADPYQFHPFRFKDNAFPSGHTAVAFALATSLARETRDQWTDAGFFLLASLTAYARLHDDKHWPSDVVMGAGVGILSARFMHRLNARIAVKRGTVGASIDF